MATLAEIERATGVTVFDYLARDAEVPVITRAACQGDVSILRVTKKAAVAAIPAAGIAVLRGETGGNTHSLHGAALWDAVAERGDSLVLGTLTVPQGGAAYLLHPERGAFQIAAGTYEVGRQREFADEWRMVAY